MYNDHEGVHIQEATLLGCLNDLIDAMYNMWMPISYGNPLVI